MSTLPKSERLRGRECFDKLFGEAAKGAAGVILVRAVPNDGKASRIAAVAGKKLGGAVQRNRMRRRIRAAFRNAKNRLPVGWDFAILARKGVMEAAWQNLNRDMELAMQRAIQDYSGRRPNRPNR